MSSTTASTAPPMTVRDALDVAQRLHSRLSGRGELREYAASSKAAVTTLSDATQASKANATCQLLLLRAFGLLGEASRRFLEAVDELPNPAMAPDVAQLQAYNTSLLARVEQVAYYRAEDGDPLRFPNDPAARTFWMKLLHGEPVVAWDEFLEAMQHHFDDLTIDDALFQYLDFTTIHAIAPFELATFLAWFGPFDQCVANMRNITTAAWFKGFLSSKDAEVYLAGKPKGHFLVRFSQTKPKLFALAYVIAQNKVKHYRVDEHPSRSGALLLEAKSYDGIIPILVANRDILASPPVDARESPDEQEEGTYAESIYGLHLT